MAAHTFTRIMLLVAGAHILHAREDTGNGFVTCSAPMRREEIQDFLSVGDNQKIYGTLSVEGALSVVVYTM